VLLLKKLGEKKRGKVASKLRYSIVESCKNVSTSKTDDYQLNKFRNYPNYPHLIRV
jgi:hypothetical protein